MDTKRQLFVLHCLRSITALSKVKQRAVFRLSSLLVVAASAHPGGNDGIWHFLSVHLSTDWHHLFVKFAVKALSGSKADLLQALHPAVLRSSNVQPKAAFTQPTAAFASNHGAALVQALCCGYCCASDGALLVCLLL
jgi:hypothetical protein